MKARLISTFLSDNFSLPKFVWSLLRSLKKPTLRDGLCTSPEHCVTSLEPTMSRPPVLAGSLKYEVGSCR